MKSSESVLQIRQGSLANRDSVRQEGNELGRVGSICGFDNIPELIEGMGKVYEVFL